MAEIKLKQKDYEAIIKNMDNELIIAKSIIRDLLKLNNDKFGQTKMDWRISVVKNAETEEEEILCQNCIGCSNWEFGE